MINTKNILFILLSTYLFSNTSTAKAEYIEYMSDDSVNHYDHFPSEDEARARCYSFVIGLGYNNPAYYCLPYGGPAWAAGWLRETGGKISHFGIFYFDKCSAPSFFNPTTGECGADGKGSLPPALACPSLMQANPINASNGNKFQRETDFQSSSNPDMKFSRSFNSKDGVWRHNFSTKLYIRAEYLALISNDGHTSFFPRSEGSTSFYKDGIGRIEQKPNGWAYTDTQNNSFFFDAEGTLISLKKKSGSELFLTRNGTSTTVADTSGNSLSFTNDAAQQPLSLTTDALNISYSYNWDKHLIQVTKKWGSQTSIRKFHYEDSRSNRLLTGISDERGVRYATWSYDSSGRAISSEHASGAEKVTLSYNADGSTTVTNELGKQTVYRFQTIQGVRRITAIEGEPSANCPASNSQYSYDERGLLKTKTDNKGHLTTYTYNDRGLEISRTEAAGTPQARTVTTEWHPDWFLPVTVTEPDRITHYTYDDQGRQLSQTITQR